MASNSSNTDLKLSPSALFAPISFKIWGSFTINKKERVSLNFDVAEWILAYFWINYTDTHLERFRSGLTHHWSQDDADAQDFAEYTFQTRN